MSKQLPIGSLPRDVQERLQDLLQKEAGALTPREFNFLRGRKDYLSSDQRKYYGLEEEAKTSGEAGGDEPVKLSRKEMKARLKELEVEFSGNAKNEVLAELLEKAEKEDSEEDENEQ